MTDTKPQIDDSHGGVIQELTRLRDEMHLKVHLATMEVRDAWEVMQPRLREFERELEEHGAVVSQALREMAEELRERLMELQDSIARDADETLS